MGVRGRGRGRRTAAAPGRTPRPGSPSRREHGRRAHLEERGHVLRRDHPADHDHDVLAALLGERLPERRARVRCPAASEDTPTMCTSASTAWRATSPGVGTAGRRRRRSRGRRRRWRSPSGRGRRPCADLGDQDAGPTALGLEGRTPRRSVRSTDGDSPASVRYTPEIVRIWLACRPYTFSRASEDLADRGLRAGRVHRQFQEIAGAFGSPGQGVQGVPARLFVALRAQPPQLLELRAHGGVVDLEDVDLLVGLHPGTRSRR